MPQPGLQLYTHEFYPKQGGIASYCHEFAQAASELGYRVQLHAPRQATAREATAGYTLAPGAAAGNHNLLAIWHTRKLLQRTLTVHPHDLHLFAEPGPILALGTLQQQQIAKARTILTLHGSEINKWQTRTWSRRCARRAMESARAIRTVSGPIGELTSRAFPHLAVKTKAVPNALPAQFRSQVANFQRKPKELSCDFEILSVGRIHPRKGFDQIIRAIGQLPSSLKQHIHYTVAGGRKDGTYLQQLQQLAHREGVAFTTRLDLSDNELDHCYRRADLFALTSIPYKNSIEGFGLVYLEAGAYALPCIGYDSGGVSDAIQQNQTGLLIAPGQIDALAGAIQQLLENPELRAQLGRNNREFSQERTWADVVRETLELVP